tara:strand:- start:16992 stop:17675 length:684 start_codon:yes stop_codon:yes gene_type:complete
MQSLIDPKRAPDVITITYNKTVTELLKRENGDGSVSYVGNPVSESGMRCKYAFQLETNGYFDGSGAMNFICQGGWGRGTKKPSVEEKAKSRAEFIRAFVSSAIMLVGLEKNEEMISVLERDTGLKVLVGEMTNEDKDLMALLQVPAYLVSFAASRGLRFTVDIKEFMAKHVQPSYAKVVEGEWDDESERVALTSALPWAHVKLMSEAGLRFQRVRRSRKKKKVSATK